MLSSEVLFGAVVSVVSTLAGAILVLFRALLAAKDAQIADVTTDRDAWRQAALSGTELAKDALDFPVGSRKGRA